jgi:hypothetical protein
MGCGQDPPDSSDAADAPDAADAGCSPDVYCVFGCNTDVISSATCVGGRATCEGGQILTTQCPPGTCFFLGPRPPCCTEQGSLVSSFCPSPSALAAVCPAGSTPAKRGDDGGSFWFDGGGVWLCGGDAGNSKDRCSIPGAGPCPDVRDKWIPRDCVTYDGSIPTVDSGLGVLLDQATCRDICGPAPIGEPSCSALGVNNDQIRIRCWSMCPAQI